MVVIACRTAPAVAMAAEIVVYDPCDYEHYRNQTITKHAVKNG